MSNAAATFPAPQPVPVASSALSSIAEGMINSAGLSSQGLPLPHTRLCAFCYNWSQGQLGFGERKSSFLSIITWYLMSIHRLWKVRSLSSPVQHPQRGFPAELLVPQWFHCPFLKLGYSCDRDTAAGPQWWGVLWDGSGRNLGGFFWGKTWITLNKYSMRTTHWTMRGKYRTELNGVGWKILFLIMEHNPISSWISQGAQAKLAGLAFIAAPLIPNACLWHLKGVPCL